MSKLGNIRQTPEEVQYIHFSDLTPNICILSQGADGDLWLGINKNRMCLDRNMVQALVEDLQKWLDTGKFN